MSNPFGGFITTSPLSSQSHDPLQDLASNCIRDYFGPIVQVVADCILNIGTPPPTLPQIISRIRTQCKRDINSERQRLVFNLCPLNNERTSAKLNMARGSEEHGFVVDASAIRAALIVLLQHSIVQAIPPPPSINSTTDTDNTNKGHSMNINQESTMDGNHTSGNNSITKLIRCKYSINLNKATLLPRYPRYIDYSRKLFKEEGGIITEEILVHGRMGTVECILACANNILGQKSNDDVSTPNETVEIDIVQSTDCGNPKHEQTEQDLNAEKLALYTKFIQCFKKMIEDGFIEIAPPIHSHDEIDNSNTNQSNNDTSHVFQSGKKRSHDELFDYHEIELTNRTEEGGGKEEYTIIKMLNTPANKKVLPSGAVWRVNFKMFHASLRALILGRLVAERYGDQVQSAGSIVTAALKFCAHKEHVVTKKLLAVLASSSSSTNTSATEEAKHRLLEDKAMFTPDDIMPYLPPPILANFKSKAGGARSNLSSSLLKLCKMTYPQTIIHVEDSKSLADGGKFEIATRQLMTYLKNRCFHQMVLDRYGEIAARICSVLEVKGHLESEAVADNAMVFVKDAREILHKLYKENFISMLYLQQGKQHNPKSAIYLWNIDKKRTMRTFFLDVCRAINNLRLRRQHEMQVGKDWIERAKEAGATDENDSELDRVHYHRFCQGLERLDNACLQLDETVMILNDFDN